MNPYAFSGQLQQSSMHQQTLWLFSGIALVLVVATLISETLRWRARAQPAQCSIIWWPASAPGG